MAVLRIEGIDSSLVTDGYPVDPGLHLLWSDQGGWPVIDLVRVQVDGNQEVTWWRGISGTDRWQELPQMFGFTYDKYLGSSRISPEAFAHFEILWLRVSFEVQKMLADKVTTSLVYVPNSRGRLYACPQCGLIDSCICRRP